MKETDRKPGSEPPILASLQKGEERGTSRPSVQALQQLQEKAMKRISELIEEEDNIERLAKLLKTIYDIQGENTASGAPQTLAERLKAISEQQARKYTNEKEK
jgi:hypothetical protein